MTREKKEREEKKIEAMKEFLSGPASGPLKLCHDGQTKEGNEADICRIRWTVRLLEK